MQFKLSTLLPAALLLASATPALSSTDGVRAPPNNKRVHRNIARSFSEKSDLKKRENGVPGTYYDVTTGEVACGGRYQPSDATVAMNTRDFAGGSACHKQITIHYNGKSEVATIVDLCPTCGGGGIDMTQGLFERFASISVGELHLDWSWGAGSEPAPTHKAPPPKPTTTHHETPTTTHTSTHHSTTQSSSSSTSSSSAAPAPTAPAGNNNIAGILEIITNLGFLVVAGSGN